MPSVLTRSTPFPAAPPVIRRITVADIPAALREGWRDFMATPTQFVFLALIYPIVGLLAGRAASGGPLLPLFWPLVAGLALLGPVLALGLYEISKRRDTGAQVSWLEALQVRHSPAMAGIAVLGIYLLALFVAWLTVARWLWHGTLAGMPAPDGLMGLVRLVFETPEGLRLLFWGNLVGALFAAAAFVGTAISFPLMLDRPTTDPGTAMLTSWRAVTRNPVPMGLWGLTIAALLFAGSIPAFVGLAVAMPWLGHATWHLYKRVVA